MQQQITLVEAEGFDDRAGRFASGPTTANKFGEGTANLFEIVQTLFDFHQVRLGQFPGVGAAPATERQQLANLAQREAEFLGAPDEAQTRLRFRWVQPDAARWFARCSDQPASLVIADGLDVAA